MESSKRSYESPDFEILRVFNEDEILSGSLEPIEGKEDHDITWDD